jgi:hypothetical protein
MPAAPSLSRRHAASPRVARLIERIRGLVAERRRLERAGARDLAKCLELDIARLQEQLASMVRAELTQT